jgi:hypothetical protein
MIGGDQQQRQFTGHPISMDFEGVDLRAAFARSRTSAPQHGDRSDVQGTVDIKLTEVPWDQALGVICGAIGSTTPSTAPSSALRRSRRFARNGTRGRPSRRRPPTRETSSSGRLLSATREPRRSRRSSSVPLSAGVTSRLMCGRTPSHHRPAASTGDGVQSHQDHRPSRAAG